MALTLIKADKSKSIYTHPALIYLGRYQSRSMTKRFFSTIHAKQPHGESFCGNGAEAARNFHNSKAMVQWTSAWNVKDANHAKDSTLPFQFHFEQLIGTFVFQNK